MRDVQCFEDSLHEKSAQQIQIDIMIAKYAEESVSGMFSMHQLRKPYFKKHVQKMGRLVIDIGTSSEG